MINIATIHHETPKFMKIQKEYLEKTTSSEFRVYCGTSHLTPTVDHYKFVDFSDYISDQHWERLDCLASTICEEAADEDLLVFMDSDAFPIIDWVDRVNSVLEDYPIVAIVRRENPEKLLAEEDLNYPHPCFCVTTVGFWKEHQLSWKLDPPTGAQSAGVVLHRKLRDLNIDWGALIRSNAINIHPLYFGIYGGVIYHHGAGNREVYDSIDIWDRPLLGNTVDLDLRYPSIPKFNTKLSNLVFSEIEQDENFIRTFLGGMP